MERKKKPKVWATTKEPNLLRNVASGRYYGRFKIAGKPKWFNCDTDVFSVAVLRISDERARISHSRASVSNVDSGVATMGDLGKLLEERYQASARIRAQTKKRYIEQIEVVFRTWPELKTLKPERVSRPAVISWRDRIARDGTGFKMASWKKGRSRNIDGSSPSNINKMLNIIRQMLEIGVERGQIGAHPLGGRGLKLRIKPKKPDLPERAVVEKIFQEIASKNSPWATRTSELCRGLAYTGCRIAEAVGDKKRPGIRWSDVDFARGLIRVRGTKSEGSDRVVPMIDAARALLDRIRARQLSEARSVLGPEAELAPNDRVFQVREATISLTAACAAVGATRLTHHDLRDVFATTCIEAGVDIPTIAAWLGHKDGGALLMKTYAHHRQSHSLAQAAKVTFG